MDISYTRVSGYLGSVILMLVGCKGGLAGWRRRRRTENGGATERNRYRIIKLVGFMTFLLGSKNRKLLEMKFVFAFLYQFEELANNMIWKENIGNSKSAQKI